MTDDIFVPHSNPVGTSPIHPDQDELQARSEAVAGSIPHPVFGAQMQPQEVHDKNLVGSDDATNASHADDKSPSFDPESDARMQLPTTEI